MSSWTQSDHTTLAHGLQRVSAPFSRGRASSAPLLVWSHVERTHAEVVAPSIPPKHGLSNGRDIVPMVLARWRVRQRASQQGPSVE
jgi:hypothetical protein